MKLHRNFLLMQILMTIKACLVTWSSAWVKKRIVRVTANISPQDLLLCSNNGFHAIVLKVFIGIWSVHEKD